MATIFTAEEKRMIHEALSIYLQLAQQQMPQQTLEEMALQTEIILQKLEQDQSSEIPHRTNQPTGINDDYFKHVCQTCDQLTSNGCGDKITVKFPGKCDPILKYKMAKERAEKKDDL